jgi:hypothetical protein
MSDEGSELYQYFQLMELGSCLSFEELYTRLKSSRMTALWLCYLGRREELENKRLQAMFAEK